MSLNMRSGSGGMPWQRRCLAAYLSLMPLSLRLKIWQKPFARKGRGRDCR
jgi:hypothetical protein